MKRRKWDSKTKATIVLEGLKGKAVIIICQEHHSQQENTRLKKLVGELTLELKKSEGVWP